MLADDIDVYFWSLFHRPWETFSNWLLSYFCCFLFLWGHLRGFLWRPFYIFFLSFNSNFNDVSANFICQNQNEKIVRNNLIILLVDISIDWNKNFYATYLELWSILWITSNFSFNLFELRYTYSFFFYNFFEAS